MIKEQETTNLDWENGKLSIKLSILLSSTYAAIGLLIFSVATREIAFFPIALVVGAPFIALVAIGPAVIIGFITGRIICMIARSKLIRYLSRRGFTFTSIYVCSLLALLIHLFFRIQIELSFDAPIDYLSFGFLQTYPFIIGIPTIIYIIAGGWFGWRTYSTFKTP